MIKTSKYTLIGKKNTSYVNLSILLLILALSFPIAAKAQSQGSPHYIPLSTPNDPYLFENSANPYYQYHLNVKQGGFSIDYPATWEFARGHALIGLLDLQAYSQHPDIIGNIRQHMSDSDLVTNNPDAINGIYYDHASWVIGVLAPSTNNNEGLSGVCQNCSLVLNGFRATNLTNYISLVENGVQAINMSFGGSEVTQENCDNSPELCELFENYMAERDIVMVSISQNRYGINGNNGAAVVSPLIDNTFPGSHPNIIQVGGVTESLEFWNDCDGFEGISACGSFATPNQELVAPARNILTAITHTVNGDSACGIVNNPPLLDYNICSGTSFAAPQVTGLVGILRSIYPQLSADNIRLLLQKTAQSPHEERHIEWGYGLINPLDSVTEILGKSAGVQQVNRAIPMFAVRDQETQDSVYSASPQVIAAALAGDLRGLNRNYEVLDIGLALHQYNIPASTVTPYSAFHILSTHNNPLQTGKELIKLYRLSKLDVTESQINLDHAYMTQPYIEEFEIAGYSIDAIEGYIFPPCDSNDSNCRAPAHTECLFARNTIASAPDWALMLESQLTHTLYQNHTEKLNGSSDICLGYAYQSIDSDEDGLIDGYEEFLGTNINDSDTDNDNRSDGQEILVPIEGFFSDPIDNSIPFQINPGLTGAWYYPDTSGQGLLFDVMSNNGNSTGEMFLAWFTYNLSHEANNAEFGDLNSRWFTAQGEYNQDKADLTVYLTEAGKFDSSDTVTSIAVGKINIRFSSCTKGIFRYSFDNTQVRGSFPITRITPDQNCETSLKTFVTSPESLSGLSGAWYNPDTSGQGLLFDSNDQQLFAAWFTYPIQNSPTNSNFGSTNHRWFTAQGTSSTHIYDMPIYLTEDGIFDTSGAVNSTEVGHMKIKFDTCLKGSVEYEFTDSDIMGSFPIIRITPNIYCQEQVLNKINEDN